LGDKTEKEHIGCLKLQEMLREAREELKRASECSMK
jgi:hypothetical protein